MIDTRTAGTRRRGRARELLAAAAAAAAIGAAGCSLDVTNPNALTGEDVFTDPGGIIALAIGMQAQHATSMADFVRAPALVTDEWGTNTAALIAYQSLLTGVNFDPSFAVVEAPWAATYRVVRTANSILDNVDRVELDAGTRSGLRALAKTYRAMALGMSAMHYAQLPIDVRVEEPVPVPRAVVLDSIHAMLEEARAELAGSPDLAIFRSRVLVGGIALPQVIDAMLARYYLVDGEYEKARQAAERVDLASRSEFRYTGTSVNPIWSIAFAVLYVQPLNSFATAAEPGDRRVAYWTQETAAPAGGNPPDTLLIPFDRYADRNAPIPVYLPDEMRLIRAEAHARAGQLEQARALINAVRTQCGDPGAAAEPVACLPALPAEALDTESEALAQIAYERRYELFSQGLRWEDLRRLGYAGAVGAPPIFDWFPIPGRECTVNSAAGCTG